jgi:hypothetical protein
VIFDDGNFTLWLVSQRDGSTGIVRIRIEQDADVYTARYSTLCDGTSEWCAGFVGRQVAWVKNFPPPLPPNVPHK